MTDHSVEAARWAMDNPAEAQALYRDIPAAVALPSLAGGLIVICCPYCEAQHSHGPGYGTRYAHCPKPEAGDWNQEYVLVPPYGEVSELPQPAG